MEQWNSGILGHVGWILHPRATLDMAKPSGFTIHDLRFGIALCDYHTEAPVGRQEKFLWPGALLSWRCWTAMNPCHAGIYTMRTLILAEWAMPTFCIELDGIPRPPTPRWAGSSSGGYAAHFINQLRRPAPVPPDTRSNRNEPRHRYPSTRLAPCLHTRVGTLQRGIGGHSPPYKIGMKNPFHCLSRPAGGIIRPAELLKTLPPWFATGRIGSCRYGRPERVVESSRRSINSQWR